ncbi:MAG: hypothetical protein GC168_15825 [Candidatus Hydrogenedens sp.]|nr:hypothetical protein [Candidatus Hydrogenedens sp.]
MTKRLYQWTLCVGFVGGLLLPTADKLLDFDPAPQLYENRVLNVLPKLEPTWDSLVSYPQRFNDYMGDNFGLRRMLVCSYYWTRLELFGNNMGDRVLIGTQDDLFLNAGGGLADLWRAATTPYNQEQLSGWTNALLERHRYMQARGGAYLFFVIPDRQTVYPESLPARVKASARPTRKQQLEAHLAEHAPELATIDATRILVEGKQAHPTYPKTNSHWNHYGAFLVYREIMNRLDERYPALKPHELDDYDMVWKETSGQILSEMMAMQVYLTDTDVDLIPKFPQRAKKTGETLYPSIAGKSGRPAWIPYALETGNPELPRAVLLADSFESALTPFLAEHFSRLVVYRQNEFDPEIMRIEQPDIVIQMRSEQFCMFVNPANDPAIREAAGPGKTN